MHWNLCHLNVLNKQNFVLDSNTSALIQVEEAQRVRKRRRDERCLLDIHKRQKQYVRSERDPKEGLDLIL